MLRTECQLINSTSKHSNNCNLLTIFKQLNFRASKIFVTASRLTDYNIKIKKKNLLLDQYLSILPKRSINFVPQQRPQVKRYLFNIHLKPLKCFILKRYQYVESYLTPVQSTNINKIYTVLKRKCLII